MEFIPLLVLLAAIGLLVWLFLRRSPRPDHTPLLTDPDDPLMVEALGRAKASLPELVRRLGEPYESALVKLYFVSSSQQVEHLWAEVESVLGEGELGVRLVTPPVTHSGLLPRTYRCTLDDVEDWCVRDLAGTMHGGFTQRAMYAIARRDGVALDPELLAVEHEFGGGEPPPNGGGKRAP